MARKYERPELKIDFRLNGDVIFMSGDGYVNDPWSEGLGGEL